MKKSAKIALGVTAGVVGVILLGVALFFFFLFVPFHTTVFHDCVFRQAEVQTSGQRVYFDFSLSQSTQQQPNTIKNKANNAYFALNVTLTDSNGAVRLNVTEITENTPEPQRSNVYFVRLTSSDGQFDKICKLHFSLWQDGKLQCIAIIYEFYENSVGNHLQIDLQEV